MAEKGNREIDADTSQVSTTGSTRRSFIKTSVAGAAVGALGALSGRGAEAAKAKKLQIKAAG